MQLAFSLVDSFCPSVLLMLQRLHPLLPFWLWRLRRLRRLLRLLWLRVPSLAACQRRALLPTPKCSLWAVVLAATSISSCSCALMAPLLPVRSDLTVTVM